MTLNLKFVHIISFSITGSQFETEENYFIGAQLCNHVQQRTCNNYFVLRKVECRLVSTLKACHFVSIMYQHTKELLVLNKWLS